MASVSDLISGLGGFYRDIEVAKATASGQAAANVRPESIPDQTSMGVPANFNGQSGVNYVPSSTINVGGVSLDKKILMITALAIGGIAIIRAVR